MDIPKESDKLSVDTPKNSASLDTNDKECDGNGIDDDSGESDPRENKLSFAMNSLRLEKFLNGVWNLYQNFIWSLQWSWVYLYSKFWFSILTKKVQRTSMSFES